MSVFCFCKLMFYKVKYGNSLKLNLSLSERGSNIKIIGQGKISSKKNLRLRANTSVVSIGGEIQLGENVFFNRNCNIISRQTIFIGNNVSMGHNVCVIDHDHIFNKEKVCGTEYNTGEIIIEDGCWLGSNVVVLRNTKIGEGSVIGAGTIVKGNIPPHSVVTMDRELKIKPIL